MRFWEALLHDFKLKGGEPNVHSHKEAIIAATKMSVSEAILMFLKTSEGTNTVFSNFIETQLHSAVYSISN